MKFELYKSKVPYRENPDLFSLEWRWRLRAKNGRIIADSGEGYVHRRDARRMIRKIQLCSWLAYVVEDH